MYIFVYANTIIMHIQTDSILFSQFLFTKRKSNAIVVQNIIMSEIFEYESIYLCNSRVVFV